MAELCCIDTNYCTDLATLFSNILAQGVGLTFPAFSHVRDYST